MRGSYGRRAGRRELSGNVIAVANMKGGVGKTATVIALAEALAAGGRSVLVIDADAQANASICIVGDRLNSLIVGGRTLDAFLDDVFLGGLKKQFSEYILDQASNVWHAGQPLPLSLLAASAGLRTLEREMVYSLTARRMGLDAIVGTLFRIFDRELRSVGEAYEYVLIDCAPGISAVTEASIRLADLVIVPSIPDFLSSYGLRSFCNTLWSDSSYAGFFRPRRIPQVLVTRKRATQEHERYLQLLKGEHLAPSPAFTLFETIIPETTRVSAGLGSVEKNPTFQRKWGDELVSLFKKLVAETEEALNGH